MAVAKKVSKINAGIVLFFAYIILFPFGQLLRITVDLPIKFVFQPIDLPPLLSLLILLTNIKKREYSLHELIFPVSIMVFSYLLSIFLIPNLSVNGLFYFIRLFSYFCFFIVLKKDFAQFYGSKKLVMKWLLVAVIVSATCGLLQYVYYPDLRDLKYLGWDDHLYRLTGTFLDPGFTGLIFVLGVLINIHLYFKNKNLVYILWILLLMISIALTYSRASFLSLIFACAFIILKLPKENSRKVLLIMLLFLISIPLLPRPSGQGVRLERTYSINYRLINYRETLQIFTNNPLFGVGFNNLCSYKINTHLTSEDDVLSHSCSGSDSSILMLLATTGVVGFTYSIYKLRELIILLFSKKSNLLYLSTLLAIIIHSMFNNSLFYPWVMGWMAILFAVAEGDSKGKN